MSKITAIILAKDEENMIADCIESVSFCDETIIIDNGSIDNTIDIAKKMGTKVYTTKLTSFAEMRNFGLTKARTPWVLYIDADERISSNLREKIYSLIRDEKSKIVAYRLMRKNYYLGKHEWPSIEKLERLFKKNHLVEWFGELHETPKVDGEIGEIKEGFLLHYTHRDLSSMVKKTMLWSGIEANLRYKANHPRVTWWRFPRVMLTAFYDSYIRQKGYKVGTVGVIESVYQAFSIFITYARLWELQQK